MIKVYFLADDEIVKGIKRLLRELLPAWDIVGQKPFSSPSVVSSILRSDPDVIIVQHKMSDHRIITAVQQIKKSNLDFKVLMLLFDETHFWSAIDSKADGYVLWPTAFLARAVEALMNGGVWLGPMMMEYLLRGEGLGVLRSTGKTVNSLPPELETLSGRERQVLGLLTGGLTNYQIADSLNVSVGTVKVHVRRIFAKLNLKNRGEAIARFARAR